MSKFIGSHINRDIGQITIETKQISKRPIAFSASAIPKEYESWGETLTCDYQGASCSGKTAELAAKEFCRRFCLKFQGTAIAN